MTANERQDLILTTIKRRPKSGSSLWMLKCRTGFYIQQTHLALAQLIGRGEIDAFIGYGRPGDAHPPYLVYRPCPTQTTQEELP
jgi:hypothetical protein